VVQFEEIHLGVCERCSSQFKSDLQNLDGAQAEIASAFNAHKCILQDASQNALRDGDEALIENE
jgi:uncharacterized Zn ribbon protein